MRPPLLHPGLQGVQHPPQGPDSPSQGTAPLQSLPHRGAQQHLPLPSPRQDLSEETSAHSAERNKDKDPLPMASPGSNVSNCKLCLDRIAHRRKRSLANEPCTVSAR